MRSYVYLFALLSVTAAREFQVIDDPPIEKVRVSYGEDDHERVEYIRAVIRKEHINEKGRNDFPRSGYLDTYFKKAMAKGDERGHLVGSQFSGSAQWYNLSPQNSRVNRNEGYQSITTDWYGTECQVREFLDQKDINNRHVTWEVTMSYTGKSNRPDSYLLLATFFEGGKQVNAIEANISNPFFDQDKNFWICRECRSSKHDNEELRKTGKGCSKL